MYDDGGEIYKYIRKDIRDVVLLCYKAGERGPIINVTTRR